jgi:hypothetical protein
MLACIDIVSSESFVWTAGAHAPRRDADPETQGSTFSVATPSLGCSLSDRGAVGEGQAEAPA